MLEISKFQCIKRRNKYDLLNLTLRLTLLTIGALTLLSTPILYYKTML